MHVLGLAHVLAYAHGWLYVRCVLSLDGGLRVRTATAARIWIGVRALLSRVRLGAHLVGWICRYVCAHGWILAQSRGGALSAEGLGMGTMRSARTGLAALDRTVAPRTLVHDGRGAIAGTRRLLFGADPRGSSGPAPLTGGPAMHVGAPS